MMIIPLVLHSPLIALLKTYTCQLGTKQFKIQNTCGRRASDFTEVAALRLQNSKLRIFSPMPNAQCPMPNAQCPMPDAQCPMPNAQCPMPDAQCPLTID